MDQKTLLLIRNLKKMALEKCEDRVQKERDREQESASPFGPTRRQHGMTSVLKHRHGL